MGKEVTVTYAADWSEYHSYDGWYNMDELWSSQYIDVVA
ncbi:MAG: baseplate megatron protein TIM-barrel domain-containing protein [Wolbachia sp.]